MSVFPSIVFDSTPCTISLPFVTIDSLENFEIFTLTSHTLEYTSSVSLISCTISSTSHKSRILTSNSFNSSTFSVNTFSTVFNRSYPLIYPRRLIARSLPLYTSLQRLDFPIVSPLSPFSTRRICSRDAKRKQEFSNVIGWRKSSLLRQPITLLNSCFRFASREQIRLVENGL